MNTNTPVSKSQKRAMALTGISIEQDSYFYAAEALASAGYERDGIPAGQTWRTAAKLTDAALLAGVRSNIIEMPLGRIEAAEGNY